MEIQSKKKDAFVRFLARSGISGRIDENYTKFLSDNILCDGYHNSINLGASTLLYQFLEEGPCSFKVVNNFAEDFRYWDYGE